MGFLTNWPKKYGEAKIAGVDPSAPPQQFLGQILNNIIGDKASTDGDSVRESASPIDFLAPEAAGALAGLGKKAGQVAIDAAPRLLNNEIGAIGKDVKPKFSNIKQALDNSDEKVSTFLEDSLPKKTQIGNQHLRAADVGENEVNYRLDPLSDVNYAVKDGKVVGHLGVDDDGAVKSVYVDPEHRGKGVAEQLYTDYVNKNGSLRSDDPMAMEPEAKALWSKLQNKYPDEITSSPEGWSWNKDISSNDESI